MARVFSLSEAAYQRGTDYDIVMLYQVLLGRNPENSQVIQDHRASGFNAALQTFVGSPEFRESVLDPIAVGGKVRRHDIVPRPSADQLNWLFGRTVLDESVKTALRQAPDWEQFFQILCGLDGFLEPMLPPPPRALRPPLPFKPAPRPVAPPPPAAPAQPASPAPGMAEILARLERLEQAVGALQARLPADQPAAAKSVSKSIGPKPSGSSKRQAR